MLTKVPAFEAHGIRCSIPNWWIQRNLPVRFSVKIEKRSSKSSALGTGSLLSMILNLTVDGEPLESKDIEEILSPTEGLVLIKGKLVEVDKKKLQTC